MKISNRLGMHARPAMVFVETACKFKADITVRRCDQSETVDGKSIMQLMMLAATQGTELEIVAKNDADAQRRERAGFAGGIAVPGRVRLTCAPHRGQTVVEFECYPDAFHFLLEQSAMGIFVVSISI